MSLSIRLFNLILRSKEVRARSRHTSNWGLQRLHSNSTTPASIREAVIDNYKKRCLNGQLTVQQLERFPRETIVRILSHSLTQPNPVSEGSFLTRCAFEGRKLLRSAAESCIILTPVLHATVIEACKPYLHSPEVDTICTAIDYRPEIRRVPVFTVKLYYFERARAQILLKKIKDANPSFANLIDDLLKLAPLIQKIKVEQQD